MTIYKNSINYRRHGSHKIRGVLSTLITIATAALKTIPNIPSP